MKDFRITTVDADETRTADGVVENDAGAWLGEYSPATNSVDVLADEDGDYIPAPAGWQALIIEELD